MRLLLLEVHSWFFILFFYLFRLPQWQPVFEKKSLIMTTTLRSLALALMTKPDVWKITFNLSENTLHFFVGYNDVVIQPSSVGYQVLTNKGPLEFDNLAALLKHFQVPALPASSWTKTQLWEWIKSITGKA